jgi:hypothetical protein
MRKDATMIKTQRPNLARIVYEAYPHSDLLPLDPGQDCRDLRTLMHRVLRDDIGDGIGDGLFRFLVIEIVEGGEGTLGGAIRVVRRARDDVAAVLQALILAHRRTRSPTVKEDDFDDFLQDACVKLHEMWCAAGGYDMGEHELVALNDVLTQFFADKRKSPGRKNHEH